MKWYELREYKWNGYVTIAVNRNLSNCEKARKKGFRAFNGIRTRGLCVSAAVLYQPELWRPICWRPANLLSSSTHERNETLNETQNCLNCDSLRWSHTYFICIPAVHIISFCVSFLPRVDELNKLAGLQHMGLHSSGWQSTAALTQRPRVRIPLKPRNPFFRAFS